MRLPSYLVQSPTGVYHFRFIVPLRWRDRLGRRVIKRSLGVRDPIVAQVIALTLAARYARAFKAEGDMSKSPEELAAQMKGKISTFEIDRKADGSIVVRTNDTPQDIDGAIRALQVMHGGASVTAVQPTIQSTFVAPGGGMMLRAAANKWLEAIEPDTLPKTFSVKRLSVKQFVDWKKDCPITEVRALDVADFAGYLRAPTPRAPNGVSKRTVANRMIFLSGFFTWAIQMQIYPGPNPVNTGKAFSKNEKKKASRKYGWQPFTAGQVSEFFRPDNFKRIREVHSRWVALIGAHTGARVSEIAQLHLVNLKKEGGLDCIEFTDSGDGQSVKTEASVRTIPIHPVLIELGLLERVATLRAAGQTQLFPSLTGSQNGYGGAVSKSVSRYLQQLNIKPTGTGRIGFHSFRDTVISTLESKTVAAELRRDYVGHEQEKEDDHRTAYGDRDKVVVLLEEVARKLDWQLDVSGLKPLVSGK